MSQDPILCPACGLPRRIPSGEELAHMRKLSKASGNPRATQAALADAYGCDGSFIALVETGRRAAPAELVRLYVRTFDPPETPWWKERPWGEDGPPTELREVDVWDYIEWRPAERYADQWTFDYGEGTFSSRPYWRPKGPAPGERP